MSRCHHHLLAAVLGWALMFAWRSGAAGEPVSYAPIIEAVAPSVVTVYTTANRPQGRRMIQPFFENDPFWRFFFGEPPWRRLPPEREERAPRQAGQGSGVIVSADGLVVTNHHVIDGAATIEVQLHPERQRLRATLIGSDARTDIAVLRIEAPNLRPLPFADSSRVRPGDLVFAIGNPFGVGQTVSMGIVSATGRNLGLVDYEDFIQTDAPINPGNSGGALVDSLGRLIGINTAIYSRSGGNIGIGFAIPANLARRVMEQLVSGGKVVRGFFGVHIGEVTPELARKFGVEANRGALVSEVLPDSPAAKAGIQDGDVIIRVNGVEVNDPQQLRLLVADLAPGSTVEVVVVRDGQSRTLRLTVGEQPRDLATVERGGSPSAHELGLALQDLTVQARQQYDIPARIQGVLVTEVEPDSRAERAGLRAGMVIIEVEREAVRDAASARRLLRRSGEILLRVWDDGRTRWLVIPE